MIDSKNWEAFFEATEELKKPARAKQLLAKEDLEQLKSLLTEVLIGFLKKEDTHVGMKTYINHELRNEFIEKMVANPPKQEDSLENWSSQIVGEEKFGVILVGLEQYSNAFAEKAAEIVRPLLEVAGLPLHGLSFLFFMGNYGFTPFGVHKDAAGEDGILFHLGPENKEIYTWDDPKYNSIEHHTEVFHNVQEMLAKGEKYELKPGDAMFIPHYVYHIGNTPKFSLSFVLDYINPPKDRFENELIQETAEEQLIHHIDYEKPLRMDAPLSSVKNTIDVESVQKKMEIALKRKILGLKSNGGIRVKSKRVRVNFPSTSSFSIRSKTVFPLYVSDESEESTLLFARGHRIALKKHSALSQLIADLNEGKEFSLAGISSLMLPLWDLHDVYGLIQELLSVEAITVAEL